MSITKLFSVITTLAVVAMLVGPVVPAQAATAEELATQIAQLQEQLNLLMGQLNVAQSSTPDTTPVTTGAECSGINFDRNLTVGSKGNDVKCLQTILNRSADTQVAATGVGSYGNETTYFGALTKAAVAKYQAKNSISPAVGFVGPITRAKLNLGMSSASSVTLPAGCASTSGYSPTTGQSCSTGVVTPPVTLPEGCASTSGYSPTTGQSCSTGEAPVVITGDGLKVAVSASTPVTNPIVTGSEATNLLDLTFSNGNNTAVKVTKVRVKRGGYSSDTSLGNIYLYDGYNRVSDEATLSSAYASFNRSTGLFTIPAGASKTISVRAAISGSSGETVNIMVEAATDVVSDASQVSGTFPLTGNTMSVVAASAKATVDMGSSVTPSGDSSITATTNYVVWQDTLTVNNQDVTLEYIKFSQIGSITVDALANVKLDMNGVTLATGQLTASDVGQDLIFDFSAAPIAITKGMTKTLTIYADIVKGSGKTLKMSLEKTADIFVKDAAYKNYVLVTKGSSTFSSLRTGTLTIAGGTITITKRTDSPTANVVIGATNVSLAKYDIKPTGEDVKVNSVKLSIQSSTSSTHLRNVSLYLDGVQVGNTANIETNSGATGYSTVNIYQILPAAVSKVLEVKGDVYTCASSACTSINGLASGSTIKVRIEGSASEDNSQGMVSLNLIDAPSSDVDGNALTVGSGSLSVVKSSSYGDQSTAAGTDTKIGSYSVTASQYDTINISSMTVALADNGAMVTTDLANLYVKYGSTQSTVAGAVSASNVFTTPITLASNTSMTVEVWATINTTASSAEAVSSTLAITATRATDGVSANVSAVVGQTVTVANGALAVVKASDTPVAAIYVGNNTDQLLAKYTFSANYEAFVISEIRVEATTTPGATADNFTGVYLKYKDSTGATISSAAMPLISGTSTFTGQTMYVPANGSASLEVYGNLNAVGAGYADTGDRPQLALYYYKAYSGSTSSMEVTPATAIAGNQMALYKSKPTVSLVAGSGALGNGTQSLYAVKVDADAKGAVGLKKMVFRVSPSLSSSTADTIGSFKLYRGAIDITSLVSINETTTTGTDLTSGNLTSVIAAVDVVVIFATEEEIAAGSSQTYTLKAEVAGIGTTGESIQTYVKKDSSYAASVLYTGNFGASNFVWTDRSILSHSESTADWINGYLVQTLDSPSQTLQK